MKKLRVTIDGKSYDVLVEVLGESGASAPTAAPLQALAPAPAAPASITPVAASAPAAKAAAGAGDIPSPLAGKVVSIDVKVGDAVAEGGQVATVEAMKMNTYIYASRAGTVSAVLVNAGDSVDEGSPLVRLS